MSVPALTAATAAATFQSMVGYTEDELKKLVSYGPFWVFAWAYVGLLSLSVWVASAVSAAPWG